MSPQVASVALPLARKQKIELDGLKNRGSDYAALSDEMSSFLSNLSDFCVNQLS